MTQLLTAAELESMRTSLEAVSFPDTCNILSLTRTSDSEGGWTEAWGTVLASQACRLDQVASVEVLVASSIRAFSGWILSLAHDVTISAAMRVEHGGETYNVVGVSDTGSWLACRRALLERV